MKKKILIPIIIVGSVAVLAIGGLVTYKVIDNKKKDDWAKMFQEYYDNRVNLFIEENKTLENVDVAFLGDSLTEGYDVKRFYPEYNVINRGIGGDTTFGVEKRLEVSIYEPAPKLTTMLIGVNNIDTMFDNYENILQSFKQEAPEMKVVLLSLTSMCKEWGRNNYKAIRNNEKIKQYAEQYDFTFVDLYTPLLDENTNQLKEEYTTDGGHFTEEGYQVITSVIKPVIHQLLD